MLLNLNNLNSKYIFQNFKINNLILSPAAPGNKKTGGTGFSKENKKRIENIKK